MKSCKRYQGWHSSPTGKLGISRPDIATEGVGYYISADKETAEWFGRKVKKVSTILCNPLDARGEIAHILHETDELLAPPKKGDSIWLASVKEAVKKAGVTDKNWGRKQASLNQTLTDILQEKSFDGILIDNWMVKFAKRKERCKLGGCGE